MVKIVGSDVFSRVYFVHGIRHLFDYLYLLLSKGVSKDHPGKNTNETVESIQKSNKEIEDAMNQYGNSIFRLAYSYLHHMEDAEDILQETLIRYMKKAPAFESPDHEKAWLLHVAANLAKNKIKYNNVRKTDELKEELEADKEEDLSFVWDAVTKLSADQRSVIHLFYQEGYSTAQIAGLLEMKESTVRSHLKRGRDHLRSILKEEYDFE